MNPAENAAMARKAISYLRFSGKRQEAGESERRQTEMALKAAAEEKLPLDTTLSLKDKGISGFRGKNWKEGDLGKFLDLVDGGIIPKGSVLIIERVNRLSRMPWMKQVELWKEILSRGIIIRTCEPKARYDEKNMNDLSVGCPVVLHMMLGHLESKQKSEWAFDAFDARKKRAREHGTPHGLNCPSWIEKVVAPHPLDAKRKVTLEFRIIPERKALLQWMHQQAQAGWGIARIQKDLHDRGIPAWGYSGRWAQETIRQMLTERVVIGEYQPIRIDEEGRHIPDGPPVPNYYPAAVDEDCLNRSVAALRSRRRKGGRLGVLASNLFTHLVKDASAEAPLRLEYHYVKPTNRKKAGYRKYPYLSTVSQDWAFPYPEFERLVLRTISHLRAKDVDGRHQVDELTLRVESLQKRRGSMTLDLQAINQQLRELPSTKWPKGAIARMAELEEGIKTLDEELREAKEAANTSSRTEALHDVQSAIDYLDAVRGTPEEPVARQRIKARLPFLVESIWVRFQGVTNKSRYVHVRIYLHGGEQRYFYLTFGNPTEPPLPLGDADFRGGECRHYTAKTFPRKPKGKSVAS